MSSQPSLNRKMWVSTVIIELIGIIVVSVGIGVGYEGRLRLSHHYWRRPARGGRGCPLCQVPETCIENMNRYFVIPSMGPYTAVICRAVNQVFRKHQLPIRFKSPPRTTRGTVLRGWQLLDENMCLPAKINLGNYLDAIDRGQVDGLAQWDTCNSCRFKVYHILQGSVLRRIGHDLPMYGISMSVRGIQRLREMGVPLWVIFKAFRRGFRAIEEYDKSQVLPHQADPSKGGPCVGVCGEIFTMLDPNANLGVLERLRKAGAQVHVALPLTAFLYSHLWAAWPLRERLSAMLRHLFIFPERGLKYLRGLKRSDVDNDLLRRARKEAERYLPHYDVGGHGKESIVWSIYYALAGFDGGGHVAPLPLAPGAQ